MRCYYRAVDKENNTLDFLLTAKRYKKAALGFLTKAISRNGQPSVINSDKSDANTAEINSYNSKNPRRIKIRQCKYLNNIIEQDHRFIKWNTKLMFGFKRFTVAQKTLASVELVRVLKKGQRPKTRGEVLSLADSFYALVS
ncbi:Mobile element protein [hydrothermal vent metagenome]|uniref:Mobile element protein n=1 Tax=hydrothermal vent metagenome TaxID=652676 RepID=A0A3B0YIH5_9ZZZZ